MLTPQNAISSVCEAEKANEQHMLAPVEGRTAWINPSKQLVDTAIDRWTGSKLRADNTSVVTVMLDPPGPPRAQVLKNRKAELAELNSGRELPTLPSGSGSVALVTNTDRVSPHVSPSRDSDSDVSSSDPVSPTSSTSDHVRCNEISSSEDSPSRSRSVSHWSTSDWSILSKLFSDWPKFFINLLISE